MPNMNEPLTLKAGCYYRTRDGRKAYVVGVYPPDICDGAAEGAIYDQHCKEWDCTGWHADGRQQRHSLSCDDLIAEWREPKSETFVAWLTDEPGIMHIITTPEMSYQPPSGYKVLARKTVMITEGELQ